MYNILRILIASFLFAEWSQEIIAQMVFPDSMNQNKSGGASTFSRAGFPLPFPLYNPFSGVVPAIQQIQPIAPIVPILPITPPTYTSPTIQTCICVPVGTCTGTVPTAVPNDGSGIIDIRIVNNVISKLILYFFNRFSNNFRMFDHSLAVNVKSNCINCTMLRRSSTLLFSRAISMWR